jgi:predicted transcriptional regulator
MWDNDCGTLPVVADGGHVIGMITDRDICMATALNRRAPGKMAVGEVVTGKVFACSPEDDVREALKTMQHEGIRRLPVVKPDGTLSGIVSMNDVVLKAQEAVDGKAPELSYADVVSTFKGICAHHQLTPIPEQEMLQKTAAT